MNSISSKAQKQLEQTLETLLAIRLEKEEGGINYFRPHIDRLITELFKLQFLESVENYVNYYKDKEKKEIQKMKQYIENKGLHQKTGEFSNLWPLINEICEKALMPKNMAKPYESALSSYQGRALQAQTLLIEFLKTTKNLVGQPTMTPSVKSFKGQETQTAIIYDSPMEEEDPVDVEY